MRAVVDVFSGFLGAGKTMLIKKMIADSVYQKDFAIIENEFGEVAIDGDYLKGSCMQIKEIHSGCICCSVAGSFKEALCEVILRYSPKRIIIEPSGVASLSDVLKVFEDKQVSDKCVLGRVITVVDAVRFEMYKNNFNMFYKNQIQHAKAVVLSRSQLIDEEKLSRVTRQIGELNAKASVVTTPWELFSGQMIVTAAEENFKEQVSKKISLEKRSISKASFAVKTIAAQEVFDSLGLDYVEKIDEKDLIHHLNHLKNGSFGNVLRAKGILALSNGKWAEFDFVAGEFEVREAKPYYARKLCIIGTNLKKEALRALFKK